MTEKKARILLVSPDVIFRTTLRHALDKVNGLEVTGECASGDEALRWMRILNSEIIIIDNVLPVMNGIDTCRKMTEKEENCNVIVFVEDPALVRDAMSAGATYCFPKSMILDDLITSIRLTSRFQSIKAGCDDAGYTVGEIENMMLNYLTKGPEIEETTESEEAVRESPNDESEPALQEITLVFPASGNPLKLKKFVKVVGSALTLI